MTSTFSLETILHNTLILNHLPLDKLAELAQAMEMVKYQPNEIVFHQDDIGTDMYVIKEGAVKVVLADEHGQELILSQIQAGKIFGELALLSQRPRSATVVTLYDTTLYKLNYELFAQYVETTTTRGKTSIDNLSSNLRSHYQAQLLKRIPLFSTLSNKDLLTIVPHLNTHQYQHGDILFERGDLGDTLYIIMRGWVNAFVTSPEGDTIVLNQLGPSEIFGEMSLVDRKPRSAGIYALSDLEVLALQRKTFLKIIKQYPDLALSTLESLSTKMRFAATYVEQAINWSQRVSNGDYSMVLEEIEASNDVIVGGQVSDDVRVNALLSAFFKMIQNLQERENTFQQEINALKLKIEIDEQNRQEQVKSIIENPFFASLKKQAQEMRSKRNTPQEHKLEEKRE